MKTYGLLGKNIGYSFSRNYFLEKFKNEKLPFDYKNFDISTIEDLKDILKKNKDINGLNVTIPYKQEIIPYLDQLDPIAHEIGAVNVIKIDQNQQLTGYNSDHYGFKTSLQPLLKNTTKNALILGTGGASKAIAYTLQELDINFTYVSRNPNYNEFSYQDLDKEIINNYTLIINCTPLGTYPMIENHPDIPYQHISHHHILYDLIYNPEETTFMKKGKKQGATIFNGHKMLILQAEKSWQIWNKQ